MPSRRLLRPSGGVAVAVTVLAVGTACSSPDRSTVSSTAVSFVTSVEQGDGQAACKMLTQDARSSVAGATDVPCAKAVTMIDESGRSVHGVQVWGDAAQVRVGADVVFLRRGDGRWKISAAGCKPQAQGPYDCKVGG